MFVWNHLQTNTNTNSSWTACSRTLVRGGDYRKQTQTNTNWILFTNCSRTGWWTPNKHCKRIFLFLYVKEIDKTSITAVRVFLLVATLGKVTHSLLFSEATEWNRLLVGEKGMRLCRHWEIFREIQSEQKKCLHRNTVANQKKSPRISQRGGHLFVTSADRHCIQGPSSFWNKRGARLKHEFYW